MTASNHVELGFTFHVFGLPPSEQELGSPLGLKSSMQFVSMHLAL